MVIRVIAGIANNINQAVKLGNSQGKLYYSDIDKLQSSLDDVKNVQDRKTGICLSLPVSSQQQTSQQQDRENDSCEDSQPEVIAQSAGDEPHQSRTAGATQISGQRQHSEQ